MALFIPQNDPVLDDRLTLAERLGVLHRQLQRWVPSIHLVAFALYQRRPASAV
jgi:hypothetical protein